MSIGAFPRSPSGFGLLVGSRARGDADVRSDTDVLVVGEASPLHLERLRLRYGSEPQCTTFDLPTFEHLHSIGSLFLQHAFLEGRLLWGSKSGWAQYRRSFVVQRTFLAEIRRCVASCRWLDQPTVFGGHYLAPYVHAFKHVKNASIFFLAHRREYVFAKEAAIARAGAIISFASCTPLFGLRTFYDYSVRGLRFADVGRQAQDDILGRSTLSFVMQFLRRVLDAASARDF